MIHFLPAGGDLTLSVSVSDRHDLHRTRVRLPKTESHFLRAQVHPKVEKLDIYK